MLDFKNLKNKKVLVMGLGLHGGGVSVVKWLIKQGAVVSVTDLKTKSQLSPSIKKLKGFDVRYVLGKHRNEDFKNSDLVIQNPGVPKDSEYIKLAKRKGIPVENEASLFFRLCPAPIIGITGSKGKSTLTFLLFNILKKQFKDTVMAGNIRDVLMLDVLPRIKKNTKVILELSSWHLEGLAHLKKSPKYAVITNIIPEHLNRYPSLKSYAEAKKIIIKYQKANDFAVLNYDNLNTRKYIRNIKSEIFWYSKIKKVRRGCYLKDNEIIFCQRGKQEKVLSLRDIRFTAHHNIEHFLAAACLAKILGVGNKIIEKAIKQFKGLHDRLEYLGEIKGVKYYNDTTATVPQASISALKSLGSEKKKNIILLAGGADKNLKYNDFARLIPKYCKAVVLFQGTATKKIVKLIEDTKIIKIAKSMEEAIRLARRQARNGDIILLSPGAASFGLFKHEFDRGEQFKKYFKLIK